MITVNLDAQLEDQLTRLAKQEHSTPSELVKGLIATYVAQHKPQSQWDAFVEGLPRVKAFEQTDPMSLQKAMRDEWN